MSKVTIREVAAEADVSLSAVSIYLNGKPGLSEGTRQKISEAIDRLGYVPRRAAPRAVETSFLGLMVEKLPFSVFSDMFYGEVVQGMEQCARELGYHITLMVVGQNGELSRLITERHQNLAGVLLLGGGDLTADNIRQMLDESLPVMLVDNYLTDTPLDCVLADNITGGYTAAHYLIERGYQRIACIQGPSKYRSLVDRFQGYCHALIEAGRPLNPALVQPAISQGVPNKGYREMKALLEGGEPFDAVFCVSDRTAFGALQALSEAGLRAPDDVAIMGFDDLEQSAFTTPPLTTMRTPKRAMGEIAVRRLHELISGQPSEVALKTVLYTSLVVRETA